VPSGDRQTPWQDLTAERDSVRDQAARAGQRKCAEGPPAEARQVEQTDERRAVFSGGAFSWTRLCAMALKD